MAYEDRLSRRPRISLLWIRKERTLLPFRLNLSIFKTHCHLVLFLVSYCRPKNFPSTEKVLLWPVSGSCKVFQLTETRRSCFGWLHHNWGHDKGDLTVLVLMDVGLAVAK